MSLFLVRRLNYAIMTVAFYNAPDCLIHIFMLMNVLNMIYLGHCRPHVTKLAEFMDFFNETCLQFICSLIAIIPVTVKTDDEEVIGWVIIALILLVLLSNLAVIFVQVLIKVKRKLYLRRLQVTKK